MFSFEYLPSKTKELLLELKDLDFIADYTLVGGTALSLQINHRKSEDLDFIYDAELLPSKSLKRSIHHWYKDSYLIIREDKNYQIDYLIKDVKVTFFSAGATQTPFNVKEYSNKISRMNIAEPKIIAVLKMAALTQRNTIRDYYDLYYLTRHFISLEEVFSLTKKLIPHLPAITYSETLVYTDDIEEDTIAEHLDPKENISKEEIGNFFCLEIKKLLNTIE